MRATRQLLMGALLLIAHLMDPLWARAATEKRDSSARRVGVSWSNFQEERWKLDQAALEGTLAEAGAQVISADAQSSSEKQLADIESLLARGVRALVIVAQDSKAILPAVERARAEGIPVIAYDRFIAHPEVFYLSFDNREVGRLQARALQSLRPRGRYVFIKGAATDPNADFVHAGQLEVLRSAIDAGEIQVLAEQYVEGWLPEVAQRTMEQILTAHANGVDAVVCSNDGMAGGVIAALSAQGLTSVPVSGQDGDRAALQRVAAGQQAVSVWKDARLLGREAARVALALAAGAAPESIPGHTRWRAREDTVEVDARLLAPIAITRANLALVLEAGWIDREDLCRLAKRDPPPACR
jgi:D-xylose transport system substrate-binding protein